MNLYRVLAVMAVGLVVAVVLAACGGTANGYGTSNSGGGAAASSSMPATSTGGSAAVTPATGHTVTIANFSFTPQKLTVKAGTKVTWTNKDTTVHDVTSTNGPAIDATTTSLFNSGSLNTGQSFSHTFTKAGTYYYECTIHATMATMHAVIIVK